MNASRLGSRHTVTGFARARVDVREALVVHADRHRLHRPKNSPAAAFRRPPSDRAASCAASGRSSQSRYRASSARVSAAGCFSSRSRSSCFKRHIASSSRAARSSAAAPRRRPAARRRLSGRRSTRHRRRRPRVAAQSIRSSARRAWPARPSFGSFRSASATFCSGPTATSVISPGCRAQRLDDEVGGRLGDRPLGGEVLGPGELVVDLSPGAASARPTATGTSSRPLTCSSLQATFARAAVSPSRDGDAESSTSGDTISNPSAHASSMSVPMSVSSRTFIRCCAPAVTALATSAAMRADAMNTGFRMCEILADAPWDLCREIEHRESKHTRTRNPKP